MVVSAADRLAVRFRPDETEVRLVERSLALARVLLCTAGLIVAHYIQPDPTGEVETIILIYTIAAVVLLVGLLRANHLHQTTPFVIHALDVGLAAALTLYPTGLSAPFFSFLLFPLFTAGVRWGFIEVMTTVAIIEAVMSIEVVLLSRPFTALFVPRAVAIGAAGAAMGYLAEQQLRRRFEDRALALLLARTRLGNTLTETVNVAIASMRRAFRARQVLLVLQEQPSGRLLRWRSTDADDLETDPDELPTQRRDDYLFKTPGAAWHAASVPLSGGRLGAVYIDALGRRLPSMPLTMPPRFMAEHPFRRLISTQLQLSDEWVGRIFVLDPAQGVYREQDARFALRLAQRIGPALFDHYLVRRLRLRAQSLERRRIAGELHDGVTQSLLGLEMQIVVLRRRAVEEAPQLSEDLARVHGIIRDEVVTVRELMEGIRVDDVETGDLLNHLSGVVDRFSRHTGIAARFVSDGRPAPLTPYARRQLARIVHEALVNVRKHSGADRVLVRTNVDDGFWRLSIEDDGRGFPFAGRRSQAELQAENMCPRIIADRASVIGGELIVESRPGFGSRVEVAIPTQAS